jgi:hypothetical protein
MSGFGFKVDLFEPRDAEGVGELFREVYGDGYPVKIVYDPEQLVTAFRNGEYIPIIARTPDNRIVGYTALYRSAPNPGVYESGQTLVLPEYRKTPVAGLMFRHTMRVGPRLPGVEVLFSEAVCNHTFTQRAGTMFKFAETALEVDLMPAEAYEKENSSTGRVSTMNLFKTIVPRPHVVYVPKVYGECFPFLYEGFDDSRTLVPSTGSLPSSCPTEIATRVFDFAQVARVTVREAGADFEAVFDSEMKRIMDRGCTIIQVWLGSTWPWVGAVVETLRERHFFLGGVLPRWFGEDGLLMQRVLASPNWEGINLYTERAANMLRMVKDDWEKTHPG